MLAEVWEGFWRTTHASFFEPGRFCHHYEGQVFALATDKIRHVPAVLILNVVGEITLPTPSARLGRPQSGASVRY